MSDQGVVNPTEPFRMPSQPAVDAWRSGTPAQPMAPQSPLSSFGPGAPPQPTPPPKYPALKPPPMPQMPEQQKLGPAPDAKEYQQGAMAFASAMAVLGAVSSKFVRAPGGAALGAFAAALKGWQTGNLQAYESAAKKWEEDTKATIANNKQVMDQYRQVLENRKTNIDEQMSQIQLISTKYHDQLMYDAAQSKNYTMVAQIYEKNMMYTEKASEAAAKLQEKRDEQKNKNEQSANYWLSPEGTARRATLSPTEEANVKQMIELYGKKMGGKSVIANDRQQFIDEFTEKNGFPPSSDVVTSWEAERAGKVSAERARASAEPKADSATLTQLTKQQAAIRSYEKTAIANGKVLIQLADKVDQTGVPVVERWTRAGRQNIHGDTDVNDFNGQMSLYRAEVAKIISNPNLTGVLSDHAREEAKEFLAGSATAPQIKSIVKLLEGDFGRREKSIVDEINTVKGRLNKGGAAPADVGGGGAPPPGSEMHYDNQGNLVK